MAATSGMKMQLQTEAKNAAVYEGHIKDLIAQAGRGQANAFTSYLKPQAYGCHEDLVQYRHAS